MSKVTITIEFDDDAQVTTTVAGENITHNLQAAIQSVTVAANARHGVTPDPEALARAERFRHLIEQQPSDQPPEEAAEPA